MKTSALFFYTHLENHTSGSYPLNNYRKRRIVMTTNKYHLHIFDGEGVGAEGGMSAQSIGSSASTSTESPRIVYGKATEGDEEGNSQVGSDNGGASAPSPNLDAEFDELIKGKYKEQFNSRMQNGIQNRFKNAADYEGQVNQYADAVAPLMAMYGLDMGDVEGLKNAIEQDDSLYSARADAEGTTNEKYKENLKLKIDARIGKNIQERMAQEQANQERFAQWDAEGELLKESFPKFDMKSELQNETFANSLRRGNSVRESFVLAHFDEIMSGSNAQMQNQATQNVVNNFRQRAARPSENGLSKQPAVVRKADPSKLTKEDYRNIEERVRRGEIIRF